eukprot:Transcript_11324.p1 GENE.Transcript_11324~~Transcript_11324.p1  ORF type:complete len:316 (-),score=70.13 Transcript_11324:153-1028(-)
MEARTVTNLCAEVVDVTGDAPTIGVLALQGGYHEHKVMLSKLGAKVFEVRQVKDMEGDIDGLVVPGGESTTMGHLAERLGLLKPLRAFVASGRPVMGTCAGLIFLANDVIGQKEGGQELVGGLDVAVQRNFFGSQVAATTTTTPPPPPPPLTPPSIAATTKAAASSPSPRVASERARARVSRAPVAGRLVRDQAERDLRARPRDPGDLHPRAGDHAHRQGGQGALAARRQERRAGRRHADAAGRHPAGQPARDRLPPGAHRGRQLARPLHEHAADGEPREEAEEEVAGAKG